MKPIFSLLLLLLLLSSAAFSQYFYDGSGHQVGRADGLRRMQIIIFFYYF